MNTSSNIKVFFKTLSGNVNDISNIKFHKKIRSGNVIDFELKKVLLPPPPPVGNFANISYLEENFKPHLLRDVCTLCSGALVSDSLLHMLL